MPVAVRVGCLTTAHLLLIYTRNLTMPKRISIESISSNVKSAEVWTLNIPTDRRNLLVVGKTRSGKSAVLISLWLALTGVPVDALFRHPSYKENDDAEKPGKWVMSSTYLEGLTSDPNGLYVEVRFSDGSGLLFAERNHPMASGPHPGHPTWHQAIEPFPAHAAFQALLGSEARAVDYFLSALPVDVTLEQVKEGLPAGVLADFEGLLPAEGGPLEQLDAVLNAAGTAKRTAASDIKFLERSIKETGHVREVTEDDVAKAPERPRPVVSVPLAPPPSASSGPSPAVVKEIVRLIGELKSWEQVFKDWEATVAKVREEAAALKEVKPSEDLAFIEHVLAIMPEEGECPICGLGEDIGELPAGYLKSRRDQFVAAWHKAQATNKKYAAYIAKTQELEVDYQNAVNDRAAANVQCENRRSRLSALGVTDPDTWKEPKAEAPKVAGNIMPALRAPVAQGPYKEDLQVLRETWLKLCGLKDKLAKATTDRDRYAALEKACADRKKQLADIPLATLEKAASAFLPEEDCSLKIVRSLGDGSAFLPAFQYPGTGDPNDGEWCDHGATDTHLSGAERNDVCMALAQAISAEQPFAVISQPEDHGDDPEHLAAAMRAIGRGPHQCVFTATCMPHGKCPAGWTVVRAEELGR